MSDIMSDIGCGGQALEPRAAQEQLGVNRVPITVLHPQNGSKLRPMIDTGRFTKQEVLAHVTELGLRTRRGLGTIFQVLGAG